MFMFLNFIFFDKLTFHTFLDSIFKLGELFNLSLLRLRNLKNRRDMAVPPVLARIFSTSELIPENFGGKFVATNCSSGFGISGTI